MIAVVLGLCTGVDDTSAQDAIADFYRGKTIRILVGFGPGGTSSLYSQALTRHMGRHLPGDPKFVVQNMPGAGGLIAANTIANTSPRDGTEFGIVSRTVALDPLLGNKNAQFDALKLRWMGSAAVEHSVCMVSTSAPAKTAQDLTTIETVAGGAGTEAIETLFPRALNRLLGTKFKVISGYTSSTDILLAMERGEVHSFCGVSWTLLKLRKPELLREKKVAVLFQFGLTRHPDIPDVPTVLELAKSPEDRQVLGFILAPQQMGRPFFMPPGVPEARVAALRKAFKDSLNDPLFLEDAVKQGLEVQYVPGENVEALLAKLYATPKAVIDRVRQVTE
jgi:tripartite-type tricarboxylate transporter receptor subunit TctC